MKVLIVRGFPEKLNLNSYNVQELGLARALRKKGVLCDIAFFNGKEKDTVQKIGDVTIYWLSGKNILKNGIMSHLKTVASSYDVLQVHEYDQLQSWIVYTFWHKPAVIYHGPYYDTFNHGYNAKCRVFDHIFLPFSGRARKSVPALTKSPLAADFLKSKGFEKVKAVGVGLDVSGMESGKLTSEDQALISSILDTGFQVLYVGKLEERRNIPFLLDVIGKAAARDSNIHATIVGTGEESYLAGVMPKIQELEGRGILDYFPKASQKALSEVYKKADCLLFPTNYDIFGMVLLEAMYYGCVPLSSQNGGSSMLIRNGENGIIREKFDAQLWADTLAGLGSDRGRLRKMKDAASRTVREGFLWDSIADKFMESYEEAMAGR